MSTRRNALRRSLICLATGTTPSRWLVARSSDTMAILDSSWTTTCDAQMPKAVPGACQDTAPERRSTMLVVVAPWRAALDSRVLLRSRPEQRRGGIARRPARRGARARHRRGVVGDRSPLGLTDVIVRLARHQKDAVDGLEPGLAETGRGLPPGRAVLGVGGELGVGALGGGVRGHRQPVLVGGVGAVGRARLGPLLLDLRRRRPFVACR